MVLIICNSPTSRTWFSKYLSTSTVIQEIFIVKFLILVFLDSKENYMTMKIFGTSTLASSTKKLKKTMKITNAKK